MMETNERGIAKFLILCAVAFVFLLVYLVVQILFAANSSSSADSNSAQTTDIVTYTPKIIYYDDLRTNQNEDSTFGSLAAGPITQINEDTVKQVFARPSFSAVDNNFSYNFKLCSPVRSQVSSDIGVVLFEVVGEGSRGCNVKVRFVDVIDTSWNNLEMICAVNTFEDFTTVVGHIYDSIYLKGKQAVCYGGLFTRLIYL